MGSLFHLHEIIIIKILDVVFFQTMSDLPFMKYSTGTLIVSRFLKSRFPLEESLFTAPFPDFIASLLHAPPLVHLLLWTSETRFGFYNVYKELSFGLINKTSASTSNGYTYKKREIHSVNNRRYRSSELGRRPIIFQVQKTVKSTSSKS